MNDDLDLNLSNGKNILQKTNDGFLIERQLGWNLSNGIKTNTEVNNIIETHNVIKH